MNERKLFSNWTARTIGESGPPDEQGPRGMPPSGPPGDEAFNRLALELFEFQYEKVLPYRRFCQARGVTPSAASHWRQLPPLPVGAFKEWDVSSLPEFNRTSVFHSSGTTGRSVSRHYHSDFSLSVYEASLQAWFAPHLFPEQVQEEKGQDLSAGKKRRLLILTPPPAAAPDSSLVHMFEAIRRQWGGADSCYAGHTLECPRGWQLDLEKAVGALADAQAKGDQLCILATALSMVHLLEGLEREGKKFRLAPGSRLLETGGYKGRSQTIPKAALYQNISDLLGIPLEFIVSEYGMSELSSQAYDHCAGKPLHANEGRRFRFPPWSRCLVVSPETEEEVAEGETGCIQVLDLANVASVLALRTEDLGVRRGSGFEFAGRIRASESRGCSLRSIP